MEVDYGKFHALINAMNKKQIDEITESFNALEQSEFFTICLAFILQTGRNGSKKGENECSLAELFCWELSGLLKMDIEEGRSIYLKEFMNQCQPAISDTIH